MNDEATIDFLREQGRSSGPIDVYQALQRSLDREVSHGLFISLFKRAWPKIPLNVLYRACEWKGLGGTKSDDYFVRLLDSWLPSNRS